MAGKLEKFNFLKNKNSESVVNSELINQLDSFATAQNDNNNNSFSKRVCNSFTDTAFSRFTKPSRGISEAKVEPQSTETLSFRCWSERCRLMRGAVNNQNSKVAFTLAEVLITLGIIGLVAAMTLPTLIAQHRKKALQTALLKTYSELQQANLKLLADDEHLYQIDSITERRDLLMKEFKGVSAVNGDENWQNIYANLHDLYNGYLRGHYGETGYQHLICDNGGIWTDNIGRLWLFNDSDKQICVDVNGIKGPNRFGYDYFIFYPTKDDKIAPHYSNKDSEWYIGGSPDAMPANHDYTFYAVTDQHPTEKGKTYWGDYIKF